MSHLTSAQLIDLAENSVTGVSEASLSHVRSCATCQRQLEDLRATMAAVSEVPVPEPSPLVLGAFQRPRPRRGCE